MNMQRNIYEPSPLLYNDTAIFYLTFLGGPIGIVLSMLNAKRAEDPSLLRQSWLALLLWAVATPILFFLALRYRNFLTRVLSFAVSYSLALFLQRANSPLVEAHKEMGGRLASVWVPVLILFATLFALFAILFIIIYNMTLQGMEVGDG